MHMHPILAWFSLQCIGAPLIFYKLATVTTGWDIIGLIELENEGDEVQLMKMEQTD